MGRAKIVEYKNDRYKGSLTDAQCDQLERIIDIDSRGEAFHDLTHLIYELSETDTHKLINTMEEEGRNADDIDMKHGTLTPMQTTGVAYMYIAKDCMLGDSVGLGKTIETAGLVRMLQQEYAQQGKEFKYLMLTEKNLINQTRFKMVRFTGQYVHSLEGDKKSCSNFISWYPFGTNLRHSIVGSHTLLNQPVFTAWLAECYSQGMFPFDMLIVDESAVLGNSTAGISKNASILMPYFKRRIFLNATPFKTKLDSFYNQLNLLDPRLLPTKTNFQAEYVIFDYRGAYRKPSGKYKNANQFRRLIGYRYFARTREEKGAVMEGCTGKVVVSPLSKAQKECLRKTMIPQMVYDCPSAIDPDIDYCMDNVPKLQSIYQLLTEDCVDAETILIFVNYHEAQECLSEWLTYNGYSNRILCGETKDADRVRIINGFKNADFRILLTNVQKGLDFGNCDYCIFYSFDPSPANMVQFEGRITRSFDIINKHIMLLCSEGKELDRLNDVIKARAKASSEFTKADLSCVMSLLLDGKG